MEQESPESLRLTTLDWDYDVRDYDVANSKHELLRKLKVTYTESQSIERSIRRQRE